MRFYPGVFLSDLNREYPFGNRWLRLTSTGKEAAITLLNENLKRKKKWSPN